MAIAELETYIHKGVVQSTEFMHMNVHACRWIFLACNIHAYIHTFMHTNH